MRRDHVLEILKELVEPRDIVVGAYQALFDWMAICPRALNYLSTGAMGQASSHALGLAIANPDRRVIVFDGDGSLLMNVGSLASIASADPPNLFHFLFMNGTYEVNGGHPIPAAGKLDFRSIAIACGYRKADRYETLEVFQDAAQRFLLERGPVFGELRVCPGKEYPRDYAQIHSEAARSRFRKALNSN